MYSLCAIIIAHSSFILNLGGVSKSMLTLNEAIIDVKKVKSKALKWFSIFFEKLQLLLKPRLIRCLILQLLPSIPTVKNGSPYLIVCSI